MSFILKNPVSGTEIILKPSYDYQNTGKQKNNYLRTVNMALFNTQEYTFKKYTLPLNHVSSSDVGTLKQWFTDKNNLKYTQDSSITAVDSGVDVRLKEFNLNSFAVPYSREYKVGDIVLEEF